MTNAQRHIDLNCDLGEGYPHDAELMKYISSANIACGGHFGDNATMRQTIELAIENGVAIGAHPSYPDRENFGRRSMEIGFSELSESLIEQIDSLRQIALECGVDLTHVKPHGALYNDSARNQDLATVIAATIADYDKSLVLVGLANSNAIVAGQKADLRTCSEAFADRTYRSDGKLTPRSEQNAFVLDSSIALTNIIQLIDSKTLWSTTNELFNVEAETICIHGDGLHAVEFATSIFRGLTERGIDIRPKYERT